ncbi:MAG: hypothetical protein AAFP90_15690 [Planctomycetota bacterium]
MSSTKAPQGPSKINMLAPVAVVLICYGYFFHIPQQQLLQSAQRRLAALTDGAHETQHEFIDTRGAAARVRQHLRNVDAEIQQLEQNEKELIQKRDEMRSRLTQTSLPAATMQSVTGLLELHQLQVIESGPEIGSTQRADKVLRPVISVLTETAGGERIPAGKLAEGREVYKVRLQGKFVDLHSALQELSQRHQNVLPLSLQMELLDLDSDAKRRGSRVWTLTILV